MEPHAWFTWSWWLGKSAYEGLLRLEKSSNESLSGVARRCLAVPPEWSTMDVLLAVRVLQPLPALSGTPRTQRLKDHGRYGNRFEPDRTITQLYIAGLDSKKNNGKGVAWNQVLAGSPRFLSRGT